MPVKRSHHYFSDAIALLYVAALLAGVTHCSLQEAAATTSAEKPLFSDTAFPEERATVRRFYADEIRRAESFSDRRHVDIDIALADLNGDGAKEILALMKHYPLFCGTEGCRFLVLIRSGNGWVAASEDLVVREETVAISSRQTNGYFDLRVGAQAFARWNGKRYELSIPGR